MRKLRYDRIIVCSDLCRQFRPDWSDALEKLSKKAKKRKEKLSQLPLAVGLRGEKGRLRPRKGKITLAACLRFLAR